MNYLKTLSIFNPIGSMLSMICICLLSTVVHGENNGKEVAEKMKLIVNGEPQFKIVYSDKSEPNGEVVYAGDKGRLSKKLAAVIADTVKESCGEKPAVILSGVTGGKKISLHIGNTDYVKSLKLNVEDFGEDEFEIIFPDNSPATIATCMH